VSKSILTVTDLDAGYGRSQVLFAMRMSAPSQGAVAVLGRNGAGKSTLLKAIAGELSPMAGSIVFSGTDTANESTERRARRGIGFVPQEDAIFGRLTVRENLLLGATHQKSHDGLAEVLDFFPKLAQRLGQTAATLSGGERKMLAISRALLGRPRLLLLDEPTEGVWIGVIEEIADRLALLSQQMSIAEYAYVMDRGSVALEGPADRVRDDPQLLRYLAP
jgi:branched-chain amino acid transport system ATP-binding protein